MAPDPRSRRQHARDREIPWMAAAIINARYSITRFAPLLSLVQDGPDANLSALANQLAPTPGILKNRQVALTAIERSYRGDPVLGSRIIQISREVVSISGEKNKIKR